MTLPSCSQKVEIINRKGLHARAAAQFVKLAEKFNADIYVLCGERQVSGVSIMGLMMLSATPGTVIEIKASGKQAVEALETLVKLVNDRFLEDQ
jgi:phosphocarrier protein